MEKLLHWSIANAQGDKDAAERAGQPDPKMLQQLFGGGPDEPTLMKEAMAVITNQDAELDDRLTAFDNFEMLIESLDNANNIENLKLWIPLISMLKDKEADLRAFALSVIGTAVQNNSDAQQNFLRYDGGLSQIISLANDSEEKLQVRVKAFYALSNLIRHDRSGYEKFAQLGGLDIISPTLTDPDAKEKLHLRVLGLLTSILTAADVNDEFLELLRKENIIRSALGFLTKKGDLYVIDRVLNFLSQLISAGFKFNDREIVNLKSGFESIEPLKDQLNEEDYQIVKHVLS
ncbi:LAFE_0D08636g1_1 [Lachancea fermentati]|uniref:Hsp70 nucleotide exchange factor FES1 n=1 Tax=Lachancea fermentati TaxID=4955 RepID=A0A1G4MBW2_LACFM|nr:LAFE_0D08636g1_1 [Lachancea fermentati]